MPVAAPSGPLSLAARLAARLAVLVLAAAVSSACVMTDYGEITPPLDKSPGLLGCESGAFFDVTLLTIVPETRRMHYTATDPTTGLGGCFGDRPVPTLDRVSQQDAMDWNFCLAAWTEATEAFLGPDLWALAGVKDLPDGTTRLTTLFAPDAPGYTCVGAGIDSSGPEGTVVGDGYTEPPAAGPRIPGLAPAVIAIDRDPTSCQFCENIAALHPRNFGSDFSYYCLNTRLPENRLHLVPACRRDGPWGVRGDGALSFELAGVAWEGRVAVTDEGRVRVELLSADAGQATYHAGTPIALEMQPSRGGLRFVVDPPPDELAALARFALEAGLADRSLTVPTSVPEIGLGLPGGHLWIPSGLLERLASARRVPQLLDDHEVGPRPRR